MSEQGIEDLAELMEVEDEIIPTCDFIQPRTGKSCENLADFTCRIMHAHADNAKRLRRGPAMVCASCLMGFARWEYPIRCVTCGKTLATINHIVTDIVPI